MTTPDPNNPEPGPFARPDGGPLTALAATVLVLLAVLAAKEVAELIVPILFGLFLALVAAPLVGALQRRGIRRPVALTGAILVTLAVILATAGLIALSVGELVVRIPRYQVRLNEQIEVARELLAGLGIATDSAAITSIISPSAIFSFVRPVASAVSEAGAAIFILAFVLIYALAGAGSLRARAVQSFGADHPMLVGVERFGTELRRYLVVRAQLGLFAGVLVVVLLWLLGVPFPLLWGFLVFATSFVPNIGFIVALIPPTILALLEGGIVPAALVVIGFSVINVLQDHLLQPIVMGSELNLSPLVVMVSVIAWAWTLGAAGALLAVPLTVGLVMLMEAYPQTRGMAALLRSRIDQPPGFLAPPPDPSQDESARTYPG